MSNIIVLGIAGGKAENKQDGKEQCGQFFHVHDFLSKMEYGY